MDTILFGICLVFIVYVVLRMVRPVPTPREIWKHMRHLTLAFGGKQEIKGRKEIALWAEGIKIGYSTEIVNLINREVLLIKITGKKQCVAGFMNGRVQIKVENDSGHDRIFWSRILNQVKDTIEDLKL